jgi:hypothetical protein
MTIPVTRPVVGRDLDDVKRTFGLSTADACWLFGMSITKWTHVARRDADLPITDPTLALLVRFLDAHPELPVVPKGPNAVEMHELVDAIIPTDQKRFSVLMGSEASGAYRWRRKESRQSPALLRLMYFMRMSLMSRDDGDKVALLNDWSKVVEAEARARGVDNVFRVGRWNMTKAGSVSEESEEGADEGSEDGEDAGEEAAPVARVARVAGVAGAAPKAIPGSGKRGARPKAASTTPVPASSARPVRPKKAA